MFIQVERVREFRKDEGGAVAVIFSLTFLVLIVAVGMAIDMARAIRAGTVVTVAVDSAVLAGAKGLRLQNMTDDQVTALVTTMYNENVDASGIPTPTVNAFDVTIDRANSSVTLDVDADIPTVIMQIAGFKTMPASSRGVAMFKQKDLEIALQLDVTGSMYGSKMAALKTATKDLVDILIPDDLELLNGQIVRIGYAPYNAGVNAGPYASAMNGGVAAPNNCVYERRKTTYQDTDDFPVDGSSLKAKSDLPNGYNCSGAQILPMTGDKAVLKSTIDSYSAGGSTAGHLGTAFSWYLLSPEWSSIWPIASEPVAYNTVNTAKIAILMTDGEYNTVGGIHSNTTVVDSQNYAKDTCAAMKAKGIRVYTVGFQLVQTNAIDTLQHCASNANKFYLAEDANGLRMAFQAIAQDISKLRLSE